MDTTYTENLSDFSISEITVLRDILSAWVNNGLPRLYENENVRPAMFRPNGFVCLVNADKLFATLHKNKLEVFLSLPFCDKEGFLGDLIFENDPQQLNPYDVEFLLNEAAIEGLSLKGRWASFQKKFAL